MAVFYLVRRHIDIKFSARLICDLSVDLWQYNGENNGES